MKIAFLFGLVLSFTILGAVVISNVSDAGLCERNPAACQ